MTASIVARLALRYLSGFLVAKGMIDATTGASLMADAELLGVIEIALGTAAGVAAEYWYRLARKFGWSK